MLLCRLRGARGCAAEGEGALGSPGTSTGGRCAGGAGGGPSCPGPGLGGCPGAGAGVVRPRFSLPGASTVPPPAGLAGRADAKPPAFTCSLPSVLQQAWDTRAANCKIKPYPFLCPFWSPSELEGEVLPEPLCPMASPYGSWWRSLAQHPWPAGVLSKGLFALDTCRTGSDL